MKATTIKHSETSMKVEVSLLMDNISTSFVMFFSWEFGHLAAVADIMAEVEVGVGAWRHNYGD